MHAFHDQPMWKSIELNRAFYFSRWGVSEFEQQTLTKLKEVELGITPGSDPPPKKKKKRSGPNPLSCKKSKKKMSVIAQSKPISDGKVKKNRGRKRKKIPQHVKEELMHLKSS